MSRFIDLTGQQFGRLMALERATNDKRGHSMWRCLCECGKESSISGDHLRSGHTQSCGCLHKENALKHGMRGTLLYDVWAAMIQRCENPKVKQYKDYGGRGIMVCEEWRKSFEAFYDWSMASGYSDGLTIDRRNNDKGYNPENCWWTTYTRQSQNKRTYENNVSGTKGVSWDKAANKWRACIAINGKQISLGRFDMLGEAIQARKDGELKYWHSEEEAAKMIPAQQTESIE